MSRYALSAYLALTLALIFAAGAAAQTVVETPPQSAPLMVEEVPPATPTQPAPAPAVVTVPGTVAEDVPPGEPESADLQRVFVDTGVSNVRVSDVLTVAIMNQSPQSNCPSNEYIYERERPKWLFQTGRLMQAMKEGATVRVSFTCINGFQSINALQFLSPPGGPIARTVPSRDQAVESVIIRPVETLEPLPAPTPAPLPDGSIAGDPGVRIVPQR